MTRRVLLNRDGLFVSQPGVDVTTAGLLDMLFHPGFHAPVLVTKGTVGLSSAGAGYGEATAAVYYGRTIDPPPLVVAIGNAPSWNFPTNGRGQYGYLNGAWHTPVSEIPSAAATNVYTGSNIQRGGTGTTNLNVPLSFGSMKFQVRPLTDRVEFGVIGVPNGITIKYAVLDIIG